MKTVTKATIGVLVFIMLFVFFSSVFTITQGSEGIVLRLGRLVLDANTGKTRILQPGMHLKLPLIETVRVLDTRLQTVDIKSSRIVTKEKKDVMVDYYVKWRIRDLARYYKSTGGNELKAQTLLEQQLNTSLRAEFGRRTISDLVSSVRDDVMETLRSKALNCLKIPVMPFISVCEPICKKLQIDIVRTGMRKPRRYKPAPMHKSLFCSLRHAVLGRCCERKGMQKLPKFMRRLLIKIKTFLYSIEVCKLIKQVLRVSKICSCSMKAVLFLIILNTPKWDRNNRVRVLYG